MSDVQADPKPQKNAAEPMPEGVDYIEYKGDPTYGTEFLASHTITRKQAKEGAWGIDIPADLVWTRREGGPYKGRMLVPASDLNEESLAALENEPGFKRVTLTK